MKDIIDRLEEALVMRKMKPADLAEKTGLSRGSISNYLNRRYAPKQDAIYKMAQALRVDPAWLIGFDLPQEPLKEHTIPVLDAIIRGEPMLESASEWMGFNDPNIDFALRAPDNSMAGANIRKKGLVFVNRDEPVKNGDIAVVFADGNKAMIRRYYRYENNVVLRAESGPEALEAVYHAGIVRILGKVKYILFAV